MDFHCCIEINVCSFLDHREGSAYASSEEGAAPTDPILSVQIYTSPCAIGFKVDGRYVGLVRLVQKAEKSFTTISLYNHELTQPKKKVLCEIMQLATNYLCPTTSPGKACEDLRQELEPWLYHHRAVRQ